ncbi:hypothetical protein BKA62DRAFT_787472 [Auriculariales sp. MPI-PUGE-AT-0066]|nr:hypothetical protein BKA62DRAFT_787472 [Auriculariales sp. MPI-PUGE-AT-0066]
MSLSSPENTAQSFQVGSGGPALKRACVQYTASYDCDDACGYYCQYNYEIREEDRAGVISLIRGNPYLLHLSLNNFRDTCIGQILDAIPVEQPLESLQLQLQYWHRGSESRVLVGLLASGHPALEQLKLLAVDEWADPSLQTACQQRGIALHNYSEYGHRIQQLDDGGHGNEDLSAGGNARNRFDTISHYVQPQRASETLLHGTGGVQAGKGFHRSSTPSGP